MYKFKIFILTLPLILFSNITSGVGLENNLVNKIYRNYGVQVHLKYERETYFNYHERTVDRGRCEGTAPRREIDKFLSRTLTFLKKYPKRLVRKTLKDIYFCRELSFYNNRRFAGSYGRNKIWLESGLSTYEWTLHHEYSSILLRKYDYKFPKERWLRNNGYSYHGPDFAELNMGPWQYTKHMRKNGFFLAYNTTNFENDFNVIVAYLMTSPRKRQKLFSAALTYPRIYAKLKIVKSYYDWVFTR